MARLQLSRRLEHLQVPGVTNLAEAITGGRLSLTLSETSEMTITLADPEQAIINGKAANRGALITWGEMTFAVAAARHYAPDGARTTELTARSAGVQALKDRTGARTWRGLSPAGLLRLEAAAVGLKVLAQASGVRGSISRLAPGKDRDSTNTWALMQRLASEDGFVLTEVAGTVLYGQPTWLVKRVGWAVDAGSEVLAEAPDCRSTADDADAPVRVSLRVLGQQPAEVLAPGSPVQLTGVPKRFVGRYLVDAVTIDLASDQPAEVELVTPVDPEKEKR